VGRPGIAAWAGALIVPALDDVYLLDTTRAAGRHQRGHPAAVPRLRAGGLPARPSRLCIAATTSCRSSTTPHNGAVDDVLVCRLDLRDSRGNTRPAWTRWGTAPRWHRRGAARVRRRSRPKLLGGVQRRLANYDGRVRAHGGEQADPGHPFNFDVTTRDFDTGGGNRNTVVALKLRYELVDAAVDNPTIAASYSTGPEGASFTALATSAAENDGTDPKSWRFVKRTRRIRFRLTSSGPSANLKVRVLEILVRSSSRL
jgi:hypothetical protein